MLIIRAIICSPENNRVVQRLTFELHVGCVSNYAVILRCTLTVSDNDRTIQDVTRWLLRLVCIESLPQVDTVSLYSVLINRLTAL